MSIYSDLQDNVYSASRGFLNKIGFTNNQLIWQYGNGPEPKNDYCAMYIIDIRQIGMAQESTLTNEIVEGVKENQEVYYTTTHELIVQYTFVGESSPAVATQWQHEFKNNRTVIDQFYANNLAVVGMTSVKPISLKRDTIWVDNTTIDVRYRYSCTSSQQVNWVEYIVLNDVQYGPI